MNIIGTGLSGLIGSRIVELLQKDFSFEDLSLDTGVDITDYPAVKNRLQASKADWVFHLAAYTDVQAAEDERCQGKESLSWKINVDATANIASICRKTGKRLLYISTDYVFDGTKDAYDEGDEPNPQGWYAMTKWEGEKYVIPLSGGLVVRIANPYRANPKGKRDFVHKMMDMLGSGKPLRAPVDQLFIPTFVDDIAGALNVLVSKNASGIYHVVGGSALTPYEAAVTIARFLGYDASLVSKTTFAEFMAGRAPFPQRAVLKNDKIQALGVKMRGFEEGLRELARQEREARQ
ncbi:SDR family oxidoreductase [Patescibacteria group bacterium]|nr:SDR family oxidoreductase [Patescibacteria group bacterium]MBU1472734.1 SDR family oxidoreductase [Patescibacteria group bacterium]MBU2460001.1 SDR family oxidoreductase [Patescibacteria group bacterium]MBU2544341.1 SDR family oxidoreductase [Patescibacteria group bacterium]